MAMAMAGKRNLSSPLLSSDPSTAATAPRVALVTGCSEGGIGHALAKELAARGYTVIATSRSASSIGVALPSLPNVEAMELDVTVAPSISNVISYIMQKYRRIDILINNAGVPCNCPTAEIPLSLLQSTFQTNVFGPISLIGAVAPHMAQARQGKIVNVGSISGFISGPWSGAYAASKSALHALTDSLRVELKPYGVQVILVAPGGVVSNFAKRSVLVIQDIQYLMYKPYEQAIKTRAKYSESPHSVPTHIFAKKVIDAVLRKNPPRCFSYGHLSETYSFLYYMPLWVRDWYFSRTAGLAKPLEAAKLGTGIRAT